MLMLMSCIFIVFSAECSALKATAKSDGNRYSSDSVSEGSVDEDDYLEIKNPDGTVQRRRVDKNGSMIVYCYGDFDLCRDYPRQNTADMWNCLYEQSSKIKNKKCYSFVTGLQTCAKDIDPSEDCATKMPEWTLSIRHCMRKRDPETISAACRATEYYKHCRQGLREDSARSDL